ncbi:unnamed protein product [Meloidogyne enterolobii]|uniref:Uncharacterized protein n=1 Tax=Meloidogyne enterolobii TaxID=390850 RepID=A0ACB1AI19_MELEN
MFEVLMTRKLFLRVLYGKLLWSDEDDIEGLVKSLVYKSYRLKLLIEEKKNYKPKVGENYEY